MKVIKFQPMLKFKNYIFLVLFMSQVGFAISDPSRLPLAIKNAQPMDPDLAVWLTTYAESKPIGDISEAEFRAMVEGADESTKMLALISRTLLLKPVDKVTKEELSRNLNKFIDDSIKHIEIQRHLEVKKRDVLLGSLAAKIIDYSSVEQRPMLISVINEEPIYSCTQKGAVLDKINKKYLAEASSAEIRDLIKVSKSYDALSHRRRLLDIIATHLPVSRRGEFVEDIREIGSNLTLLIKKHSWLQVDDEKQSRSDYTFKNTIRKAVKKKECSKATDLYAKYIKNFAIDESTASKQILEVVEVGTSIEQCWKSSGRKKAIEFWTSSGVLVGQKFGLSGENWVKYRKAYLYWTGDENQSAKELCNEIVEATKANADLENLNSKALFTLGKIAENDGDYEKSSELYAQYLNQYPNGEDFEQAITSLVVNKGANKDWKNVIPVVKSFLDRMSLMTIDQRPVGNTSFALFWLGRAYLNVGDSQSAKEMWRRLAAEYYSTFYGAMGHYLLEKATAKNYELEPSRVSGFKIDSLIEVLNSKQQDIAVRAKALLKIGLREQARCECEELLSDERQAWDAQLMKSLLLHASGSWLEAIKIYDALPRSVRNSLPSGFERILFPRKYSDLVAQYAAKVELDPDLVFAVMRQESVFAKEAMSPVGAMGLMQLMPKTASLELTKISKDYIDSDRRVEIKDLLNSQTALFDPDLNITLGVHHLSRLLQIYKSPIFALTSYNASPAATIKWKRTIASDDLMAFIERIPYKETRSYVKLILRNYFYYKRWYPGLAGNLQEKHLDGLIDSLAKVDRKPMLIGLPAK